MHKVPMGCQQHGPGRGATFLGVEPSHALHAKWLTNRAKFKRPNAAATCHSLDRHGDQGPPVSPDQFPSQLRNDVAKVPRAGIASKIYRSFASSVLRRRSSHLAHLASNTGTQVTYPSANHAHVLMGLVVRDLTEHQSGEYRTGSGQVKSLLISSTNFGWVVTHLGPTTSHVSSAGCCGSARYR